MNISTSIIKLSNHSLARLSQRGIHEDAVMTVIQEGEIIHKQGLKFHYLPKSKCKNWNSEKAEMVKDLMVITNLTRTEVITCYKNPKAVHEVKKKSKRLSKYSVN
ncbi:DUF4258 domain-containing protein [Algoriphagus sp.]|uniref:DUF4258 domain-containing protein n=1 Tax=Algoriphagus sp. TaxID=1872435 RepID=UPI003F72AAA3